MVARDPLIQEPEVVAHERTYKAFNVLLRWCMIALGDAILVLTLGFVSPLGWIAALGLGAAVFVAGYIFVIRHEARQPLDLWTPGR